MRGNTKEINTSNKLECLEARARQIVDVIVR